MKASFNVEGFHATVTWWGLRWANNIVASATRTLVVVALLGGESDASNRHARAAVSLAVVEGVVVLFLLLLVHDLPVVARLGVVVEVVHRKPQIVGGNQASVKHTLLMALKRSVEWSKLHAAARLDYGLRLGVQVEGTVVAVPRSQLLAGNRDYAVGTIPYKDTVVRSCNENLGILHIVDLAHVSVVQHLEVTPRAVRDIEGLPIYRVGGFGMCARHFVAKRVLSLELMKSVLLSVCEDFPIGCCKCCVSH